MKQFLTAVMLVSLVSGSAAAARAQMAMPSAAASPAATDTPAPPPNASEAKFVAEIQADLNKRFPNPAAAEKAGYLRYGDEDETGAISYANRKWTSADPKHPSQLWYDVNGRLLGADYSVLIADSPKQPDLWGVSPDRWVKFGAHIHYGLAGPNGTTVYGATGMKKYAAAGGDPQHPTAAGLVKAGVVKSTDTVKFTFLFPAIWDLIVWVLPNPAGAFADKNANVKPTANAKSMD